MSKMKLLLSSFQLATQILTFQPIKANEKRFVVSFWRFFKFLSNQGELERIESTKNVLMQE